MPTISPLQAIADVFPVLSHRDGCYDLPDYMIDSQYPDSCLCGLNQAKKALNELGAVSEWTSLGNENSHDTDSDKNGFLSGAGSDFEKGEYALTKNSDIVTLHWKNLVHKNFKSCTLKTKPISSLLQESYKAFADVNVMLFANSKGSINMTMNHKTGCLEFTIESLSECFSKSIPDSSISWSSGLGDLSNNIIRANQTKIMPIAETDGDWEAVKIYVVAKSNGLSNIFILDIINAINPTINLCTLLEESHEAITLDDISVQKNEYLELAIAFSSGTGDDIIEVKTSLMHII